MRRLAALVEGLPEDAAVRRATSRGWTQADELAAGNIEMTDLWGRIVAITLGQPPEELPPRPEIEHPGRPGIEAPRKTPTTDPVAIRQFFAGR